MKPDRLLGCLLSILLAIAAWMILGIALGTFFALVWAAFEFWRP
jgi:hypothetical protein